MKSLSFIVKASIIGLFIAFIIAYFFSAQKPQQGVEPTFTPTAPRTEAANPPITINTGPFSYADAVALASPSVVNIYTTKTVAVNRSRSPILERFFGLPQTPSNRTQSGLGSGVILSEEGYIVTNYHVINGAENIRVTLYDGRDVVAKMVGADPETDLAILQIDTDMVTEIGIGESNSLRVGDVVLAIGNPFGVGQTVTMGIVSATGRDRLGLSTFENFIQTDAAINPGNSGGALINARGDLVGINTAIYSKDGGSQGIGFAIPIDMAKNIVTQVIRYGKVIRGWLGVEARDIPPQLSARFDVAGIVVTGVFRGGPADSANLQRGDIITKINGQEIISTRKLLEIISNNQPGTELKIEYWREQEYDEVTAVITERPQVRK